MQITIKSLGGSRRAIATMHKKLGAKPAKASRPKVNQSNEYKEVTVDG